MVEVVTRYSQRSDLLKRLERAHELAQQPHVPRQTLPPRSLRFRLSDQDRAQLVQHYRDGAHTTELTLRYGLSTGAVLALLQTAGVEMRRQGLTDSQIDQAAALYRSGLSLAAVAGQLGAGSANSVSRALVARGICLRPRH